MYDNVYKSDPFVGVAWNGYSNISFSTKRRVGNTVSDFIHLV